MQEATEFRFAPRTPVPKSFTRQRYPAERTENAIDRGRYDEAPYFGLRRVLLYPKAF